MFRKTEAPAAMTTEASAVQRILNCQKGRPNLPALLKGGWEPLTFFALAVFQKKKPGACSTPGSTYRNSSTAAEMRMLAGCRASIQLRQYWDVPKRKSPDKVVVRGLKGVISESIAQPTFAHHGPSCKPCILLCIASSNRCVRLSLGASSISACRFCEPRHQRLSKTRQRSLSRRRPARALVQSSSFSTFPFFASREGQEEARLSQGEPGFGSRAAS
jgi:hypothetical protein